MPCNASNIVNYQRGTTPGIFIFGLLRRQTDKLNQKKMKTKTSKGSSKCENILFPHQFSCPYNFTP